MTTKTREKPAVNFWAKAQRARDKWKAYADDPNATPTTDEEERILDIIREEQCMTPAKQAGFQFQHFLEWSGNTESSDGDLIARSVVVCEDFDVIYYSIRFLPESKQFAIACPGVMSSPELADTLEKAKQIAQGYEDELFASVRPKVDEQDWPRALGKELV